MCKPNTDQSESITYTVERTWGHTQVWVALLRVCPSLTRTCLSEATLSSPSLMSRLSSSCWSGERSIRMVLRHQIRYFLSAAFKWPVHRASGVQTQVYLPAYQELGNTQLSPCSLSRHSTTVLSIPLCFSSVWEEDNWKRNWRWTISIVQNPRKSEPGILPGIFVLRQFRPCRRDDLIMSKFLSCRGRVF